MTISFRTSVVALAVFAATFAPPCRADEHYTYDHVGRLTSVTYSDSTTLTYTYDHNGNILSITAGGPSAVRAPRELPSATQLDAVAPNPTTGAATVRVTVAASATVRLTVMDVLGRERVVTDQALTPGVYIFALDAALRNGAASVPAGVYLCTLKSAGHIATRAFVVAR